MAGALKRLMAGGREQGEDIDLTGYTLLVSSLFSSPASIIPGGIAGILTPFFESPLRQQAEKFENLTAYVDRMMLQYYPEFAWAPLQQQAA